MQTNVSGPENSNVPPSAWFVGRDGTGYRHWYSGVQNQIFVLNAQEEIVHSRPIGSLNEWVDVIGGDRGWDRLDYDLDPWEGIANEVAKIAASMEGED
jgi:hypothetical protein